MFIDDFDTQIHSDEFSPIDEYNGPVYPDETEEEVVYLVEPPTEDEIEEMFFYFMGNK